VLRRPCPECGLDTSSFAREDIPGMIRANAAAWQQALAGRFAAVSGDQWRRPGRRSDGAVFTVETFGRYLVHDPVHHLYDVTGVRYAAAS
jgi:hypothetical protein